MRDRNSLDKNLIKQNRPPKVFIILFGILFVIASLNLINDFRTFQGLKPFGLVEDAWAAIRKITNDYAPNTQSLANNLSTGGVSIIDSPDRCQIIDPNLDSIKTVAEIGTREAAPIDEGKTISGINQAPLLDNAYDAGAFNNTFGKADSLGMSYVLAMATRNDSATVASAASFVNAASEKGLIPIIRLCYIGKCDFNSEDSIFNFYRDVHNASSGQFIAMLGPNEAGTGSPKEMYGFVGDIGEDAAYAKIVTQTNSLADRLSTYRVENGGRMYFSPGAFNLTNSQSNDVLKLLYGGSQLDLSKFDYVMGNTYESSDGAGEGGQDPVAYNYYENGADGTNSLKAKVDEIGIKVVITEYGIITDPDIGTSKDTETIARAKESFSNLCNDPNIAGILFYRSVKGLPETELEKTANGVYKHAIDDSVIKDVISSCQETKQEELKDWAWANCNFDSCLYPDTFDAKSTAISCGSAPANSAGGYYLLLNQEGDDFVTKKIDTVEVSMPIKQFGSNSPKGAAFANYTPISYQLAQTYVNAKQNDSDKLELQDALNQFAGRLKGVGTEDYPMPWLGSAINSSSRLIQSFETFQSRPFEDLPTASEGSKYDNKDKELELESEKDLTLESLTDESLDERTLCVRVNGEVVCEEKENVLNNSVFQQDYLAPLQNYTYAHPAQCENTNLVIRNEPENYIIGPEIKIGEEKKTSVMNVDTMCKEFAQRKTSEVNPDLHFPEETDIFCRLRGVEPGDGNKVIQEPDSSPVINFATGLPLTCADKTGQLAGGIMEQLRCKNGKRYVDNVEPNLQSDGQTRNRQIGDCDFDDISRKYWTQCLYYLVPNAPDSSVYFKSTDYAEIPNYEIPGVYDSVYEMYKRLQDTLSASGRKIIFRENVGWDVKTSTKVRDLNREFNEENSDFNYGKTPYLYAQEGMPSCNLTDKMFKNESYLAKGEPVKTKSTYYDWLGTLDIMQEIQATYVSSYILKNSTPQTAEEFWSGTGVNPSAIDSDLEDKLYLPDGETINGIDYDLALKQTSFPLYTCDQIEKANILNGWVGTEKELRLTCLAHLDDEYYQNDDELVRYLHCEKGYEFDFPVVCEPSDIICYAKPINKSNTGTNTTPSGQTDTSGTPTSEAFPITTDGLLNKLVSKNKKNSNGFVVDTSKLPTSPTNNPSSQGSTNIGMTLISPVQGYTIVKGGCFGPRASGEHTGIDLAVPSGTPVKAAAAGTVIIAGWDDSGYGKLVKIDHGNNVFTLYAHNNQINVRYGQKVSQGEVISLVGSTGNSTGPHLHFEIRVGPKGYLDPASYIGATSICPPRGPTPPLPPGTEVDGDVIIEDGVEYEIVCEDPYAEIPACIPPGSSTDNLTGDLSSVSQSATSFCAGALCKDKVTEKGGVPYPQCPNLTYSICDSPAQMQKYFGNGDVSMLSDPNMVCTAIASKIGPGVKTTSITFLGNSFTVNTKIVPILKKVEEEINKQATSRSGATYTFPSGPYTFRGSGAFVPRPVRGHENDKGKFCRISNHSWGTALDLNASDNPMDLSCTIDMPPEVVYAFEKYGFRWGGRYGGQYEDENGKLQDIRADGMHFEYCVATDIELDTDPPSGDTENDSDDYVPPFCETSVIVEPPDGSGNSDPGNNQGNLGGYNEFNCGSATDYQSALTCTLNTLSKDIYDRKYSLAKVIDKFGPYCDTEYWGVSADGKSLMPFAKNYFNLIYDKYAIEKRKTADGKVCNSLPPYAVSPRPEDVKKGCYHGSWIQRWDIQYIDEWKAYREELDICTLKSDATNSSGNKMSWEGSTDGQTVGAIVDKMIAEVQYSGCTLKNVPRQKVVALVQQSKNQKVNPYLTLSMWGTESCFGQSK